MNRRQALGSTAYAAALFGLPPAQLRSGSAELPPEDLYRRDPEAWWDRLRREQFLIRDWRVFLQNGSLGIAPRRVIEAVAGYLDRAAALENDDYPRWGYETLDEMREELARFLGCDKDELALTHNATEAMNTIANGLDLKAGDEVVMTDQEHPSGRCPWLQKQARFGVAVREAAVPLPPRDPGQLADLLVSAIGPRTRVLSFSGITTRTGLVFPVRQICDAARAKGVLTVVDGAHMNGQIPVNLRELGCDFFAGSPHKWMFAPAGCGLLYGRPEALDRLWVNVATGGWDDRKLKAARFMMVGTNNRAIFEGLIAGLRFLQKIGPERSYARQHQLARRVLEGARGLAGVELLTPADDRMYGAMVTLRFARQDVSPLWELARKRRIWLTGGNPLRVSTHVHTRPSDVEAFFATVRESGVAG